MLMKWLIASAAALAIAAPAFADQYENPLEGGTSTQETLVPQEEQPQPTDQLQEKRMPEEGARETVVPGEQEQNVVVLQPTQPHARALPGVAVELGGGYNNFTQDLGDTLRGGGDWSVRGIWGVNRQAGIEAAYFGSANRFGDETRNEYAITSAGELLGRVHIARPGAMIKPFVGAGLDYFRLDVIEETNDPLDGMQSIGIPVAAGVNVYPMKNLNIGARGSYRFLTEWLDEDFPDGDQWNVGLTVGAAF